MDSHAIFLAKNQSNFFIELGPWIRLLGFWVVGSWELEGKSLARGRSRRLSKIGPPRPSRSSPSTRVRTTSPMGATSLLYVSNDVGCFGKGNSGSQKGAEKRQTVQCSPLIRFTFCPRKVGHLSRLIFY